LPEAGLSLPIAEGTLSNDGELIVNDAVGSELGVTSLKVRYGSLVSPKEDLTVTSNGTLTLKALSPSLEFLTPSSVILLAELNGSPLPAGALAELFGDPAITGLPSEKIVEPSGLLTLPSLIATGPGPVNVRIKAFGLESNEAPLTVTFEPKRLTLAAYPDPLEFLTPTDATFYVNYRGSPIPAGLSVTLSSLDGKLTGLGTFLAKASGTVEVKGVKALWPTGPLSVGATIAGFSGQAEATLGVYLVAERIGGQFAIDPLLNPADFGQSALNGQYQYIASCQTFTTDLFLAYRNEPLPAVPVAVNGFRFSLNGQSVSTTAGGALVGTIYYSREHRSEYQANQTYSVEIGGVTAYLPGPIPLNFEACTP
jgi:hypothetical protein